MMVHIYIPAHLEDEAERSPVQASLDLHNERAHCQRCMCVRVSVVLLIEAVCRRMPVWFYPGDPAFCWCYVGKRDSQPFDGQGCIGTSLRMDVVLDLDLGTGVGRRKSTERQCFVGEMNRRVLEMAKKGKQTCNLVNKIADLRTSRSATLP